MRVWAARGSVGGVDDVPSVERALDLVGAQLALVAVVAAPAARVPDHVRRSDVLDDGARGVRAGQREAQDAAVARPERLDLVDARDAAAELLDDPGPERGFVRHARHHAAFAEPHQLVSFRRGAMAS